MRYLLDTNTVSEPLRRKPVADIVKRLTVLDGEAAIPAPVWHELRFGCARLPPSRHREEIEHYIMNVVRASFPVLDYNVEAAEWHALERARLSAVGKTPPFVDGQIAAIAYVNDLILITSNTRDFADFQELRMQSWA